MKNRRKFLEAALFAVTICFVLAAFIYFFSLFFLDVSHDIRVNIVAAFAGAFFAFLFLRFGEGMQKVYERHVKHYNALVELEFFLNRLLNTIQHNLFICTDYKNTFLQARQKNLVIINPHRFCLFPIKDDLVLRLFGQDIINRFFSYSTDLEKMNSDLESTRNFYDHLIEKTSNFDKDNHEIVLRNYIENVKVIESRLGIYEKFLEDLQNKTLHLAARVRVLSKMKPFLTRIIFKILQKVVKIDEVEIMREEEWIKKEIQEVQAKNKAEIDIIINT